MIKEAIHRVLEFFDTAANALTRHASSYWSRLSGHSQSPYSWDRPDYAYWRRVYFGRAKGLELSGLFVKPLVSKIASWTMGRTPSWSMESETAEQALNEWWTDRHPAVLSAWRTALTEGDSFLVVNPDLSITIVPAELVEPIVSDDDYSDVIGWRVTQTYPHPTRSFDKQTVVDEYTLDGRVRIWEQRGVEIRRESWPNLIDRLPIIHIPNQRMSGEAFGHPEAEALVTAFQRYGATLDAALDGNQLQGRPTPVLKFETVEGYNRFWTDYGSTENQELPDGTSQTVETLDVDLSQLLTVAGAEFSYESPGSFAQDTIRLLEILFYLILEHTELPEFVFGNAISSSKASAETQLPVFIRFVEMRRAEMTGWLTEIAEAAMGYLSILRPGVTADTPQLQWEQLEQGDGRLALDVVSWAFAEGLIDRRTALLMAPLDVDDIDDVLDAAENEKQERMKEQQEQMGNQGGGDLVNSFFNREIRANEEN